MKTKTLRAVEYSRPYVGHFVVSYKGEVLNEHVSGADLFDYALDYGFTHVEVDRVRTGIKKLKAYRQADRKA